MIDARWHPEHNIDLERAGAVWMQSHQFLERLRSARAIVARALERSRRPYVAVSGGKDSLAMLAIVVAAARLMGRPVRVWSHVSDASFPGTRETIEEACRRLGVEPDIDESPVSAYAVVGRQSHQKFGKTGYFFRAIKAYVQASALDLCFVGVRAAESRRRWRSCSVRGPIFPTEVPCHILKCQPLYDWHIEDVAAALHLFNMPVHPIYRKLAVEDMPIRLGYVTSLDLLDKGTAVFLRRNYPRQFERLAQAMPEIRSWT